MSGHHHPDYCPRVARERAQKAAFLRLQQARQVAARRLQDAARFAANHAAGVPLLNQRQGTGDAAVLVRLEWPGVLRVLDPLTGRELARSEPGEPGQLAADFYPPAYLNARGQS